MKLDEEEYFDARLNHEVSAVSKYCTHGKLSNHPKYDAWRLALQLMDANGPAVAAGTTRNVALRLVRNGVDPHDILWVFHNIFNEE